MNGNESLVDTEVNELLRKTGAWKTAAEDGSCSAGGAVLMVAQAWDWDCMHPQRIPPRPTGRGGPHWRQLIEETERWRPKSQRRIEG